MKTLHPDALSLRLSSSYRRSLAHILNAAPALSDCSICSKPILTIIRSLITSLSCKLLVLWSTHSFFRFVPFSLHRASSMDTHSIFQLSLLLHTVNPLLSTFFSSLSVCFGSTQYPYYSIFTNSLLSLRSLNHRWSFRECVIPSSMCLRFL